MLLPIAVFLLNTVFFFLIAAALLRAWMNQLRIPMVLQPGPFVMALSNPLVQPLRRILPAGLKNSRVDWASLFAGLLLALFYALLWWMLLNRLFSGLFSLDSALAIVVLALKMLLRTALHTLQLVLVVYAVLSWMQPGSPAMGLLDRLTAPLLQPIRRVLPSIGGLDLSALVLLLLAQIGLMLL